MREDFGETLFDTRIRRTVALHRAEGQGKSILQTEPTHPAAEDYRHLAREFEKRLLSRPPAARGPAWLGRMSKEVGTTLYGLLWPRTWRVRR